MDSKTKAWLRACAEYKKLVDKRDAIELEYHKAQDAAHLALCKCIELQENKTDDEDIPY